jgi:cytochrome c
MLADKIRKGSTGAWGSIAMPANAVSAEEASALAQWVLGL